MSTLDYAHPPGGFHPGFRARRGLNWGVIGLMYTSFYMCRYNFSIANKSISEEFGFSKGDVGKIITTALLAYAFGQIINGLITDRIGGKKAMLIGAAGTIIMNIAFGAASFAGLLGRFVAIRGVDGYMQAFGAPGMIKINTAWFRRTERGRFAGIFGFMINLGRFGIFKLGPALLAGFVFLGMWNVPPLHWRWLFWAPAMVCAVVAVFLWLLVKDTPQEAGFAPVHASAHGAFPAAEEAADDRQAAREAAAGEAPVGPAHDDVRASFSQVFMTIVTNAGVWIVALAYACTGAVRQGIDQWFPRYMSEVYHVDMKSAQFQVLAWSIPIVATLGSLTSGYVSDIFFGGRRAPVAAMLYLIETGVILLAAQMHTANMVILFFVLIAFTANSTHSILGTAAAMDIGGRKMAGFASGCIDSFQYFGGALAGWLLGSIVEQNWNHYFYFMAPFGVIGALLMLCLKFVPPPAPHKTAPGIEETGAPGAAVQAPAEV
jgi:OPA family glycerol-3-phosphate transporter-like MFS transporter